MELRKIITTGLKEANVANDEIYAEANFILRNFFNIKNPYFPQNYDKNKINQLRNIFEKRAQGLPLQYILNCADFWGETFFVDENVLIPRPETEILVKKVIEKAKKTKSEKILDIGTGSGCIPIILKKELPQISVTSCDISKKALETANINRQKYNLEINFIHSDLFQNITGTYDIIVSNPPYIPPKEKKHIQKEVCYEPDLALYTNDKKGIEFYEKIIREGQKYLPNTGFIFFELGINQSELVKSIFLDYNYSQVEITKDFDNIDRIISARKTNG